jgi:hypothetical protein
MPTKPLAERQQYGQRDTMAAVVAAAGKVRTHAMTISRATPQRTAESRRVLITPDH